MPIRGLRRKSLPQRGEDQRDRVKCVTTGDREQQEKNRGAGVKKLAFRSPAELEARGKHEETERRRYLCRRVVKGKAVGLEMMSEGGKKGNRVREVVEIRPRGRQHSSGGEKKR